MIRKLKTLEAFVEEFRPLVNYWYESNKDYYIEYNDMTWFINPEKKELFGTEIEVEEIKSLNYTHEGEGWNWHELWFEPVFVEFLSMEEVEV